jgi:hypothetical protein
VSLGHDAVLHAVIEFGAAVNGNGRSAGGVDEGDEFYSVSFSGFFHHGDSNKAGLPGWKGFDLKVGKSFLTDGTKTLWNSQEGYPAVVQFDKQAFPRGLKPCQFTAPVGAAGAAPFQNNGSLDLQALLSDGPSIACY